MNNKTKIPFLLFISASLYLADLIFFRDVSVLNDRMFFGIAGSNIIGIIFAALVILLILRFIQRLEGYEIIFAEIVLAGGITNILERLFSGGVIDYIYLKPFPSFNISDALIVFGLASLIFLRIKKHPHNP